MSPPLALLLSFLGAAPALQSVALEGFPFVQQKPDFCGEAAVEMALRRVGRSVTQDDVFNASGLDPLKGRGLWTNELAQALRRLDVDPGPTWYRINPARAEQEVGAEWAALHQDLLRGTPSIVCMHYDASPQTTEHFRLVTGYDSVKDEVIYQEAAEAHGANRRMDRGRFLSLWPFKPAADRWTVIRLRLDAPKDGEPLAAYSSPTPAEVVQRVMELKKTLPDGFTLSWEKPFLVVGNETTERGRSRGKEVVRWTQELLLKDFFAKAPEHLEEVWIFKDAESYLQYSRQLFRIEPSTPYGFYLSNRRAMVMNIKPGYGTLTHELVHPFMHANWPEAPAWLNEGLGSLFEQPAERDGHFIGNVNWRLPGLQAALKQRAVPKFSALIRSTDDEFYADDSGVHYAMARYLCYWLQERGLLVKLVSRAQELKAKDRTGWQALREVLGENPDLAQKEWEQFVMGLKRRS